MRPVQIDFCAGLFLELTLNKDISKLIITEASAWICRCLFYLC